MLENARHARNNGLTVGVPHSEKTKLLLSKIHKERAKIFLNPNSKKVVNIDTGETFLTAKEAAKVSGYNYSHFIEMLKGSVNNKSKFKYA